MPQENMLTIKMPTDLKHRMTLVAAEQGVSLNQLVLYMFAKELGNLEESHTISTYWEGYSQDDISSEFDDVMAKVQERSVPEWDSLS